MIKTIEVVVVVALVSVVVACGEVLQVKHPTAGAGFELSQVRYEDLAGWDEDQQSRSLEAFVRSCKGFRIVSEGTYVGGFEIKQRQWQKICAAAKIISPRSEQAARSFFYDWLE